MGLDPIHRGGAQSQVRSAGEPPTRPVSGEQPVRGARITVGIADGAVSNRRGDELITYALGSCLGLAIYDPVAGIGGLFHGMLPSAASAPDKAATHPWMFVELGVPKLFHACYQLGAQKHRLVVVAAGGASLTAGADDAFQVGHRNITILRKLLWKNSVLLHGSDLGGFQSRTMSLDVATGEFWINSGGVKRLLKRAK